MYCWDQLYNNWSTPIDIIVIIIFSVFEFSKVQFLDACIFLLSTCWYGKKLSGEVLTWLSVSGDVPLPLIATHYLLCQLYLHWFTLLPPAHPRSPKGR